jgi:hypothetical protein
MRYASIAVLALLALPLWADDEPLSFYFIPQCRWVDTRLYECVPGSKPKGKPCPVGPLVDGETRRFNAQAAPICRSPAGESIEDPIPLGAKAVLVNVTAIEATGAGCLSLYETGVNPLANLRFRPESARANNMIVGLGQLQAQEPGIPFVPDTSVTVLVPGGGSVHVVIDLVGYAQ